MAIDAEFLGIAQKYFNPYTPSSGTEHMSMLLYALARMTRPKTVVEFGSGYSTLWLLRAMADNYQDAEDERSLLVKKTKQTQIVERLENATVGIPFTQWDMESKATAFQWFASNDKSCGIDPAFYLDKHTPRLYSFESLPSTHPYVKQTSAAVQAAGLQDFYTPICGNTFSASALPPERRVIDWAWNDHTQYREFFREFWELLNPAGGLMLLHNIPGSPEAATDVAWMMEQRSDHNDMQVLVLEEPHKLDQKGCAILRRTSAYNPRNLAGNAQTLFHDLRVLLERADS